MTSNMIFNYNNLICLKALTISNDFFFPFLVKEKNVLGPPLTNPFFRKSLNGLSNFLLSGHWEYFKKEKLLGNKEKHSLTKPSKLHSLPLLIIECIAKTIKSLSDILE